MQAKMIAGHELTPGKTVKDHIHVEGTELHVPHVLLCGEQPGPTVPPAIRRSTGWSWLRRSGRGGRTAYVKS